MNADLWGSTDDDDDLILSEVPELSTKKRPAVKCTPSRSQPKIKQEQTSWITSSFDQFDDFGHSSMSKKPTAKPVQSRKRARDTDLTHSSQVSAFSPDSKQKNRFDELWADKYVPKSLADLAVHKKKIEEVDRWLRTAFNNCRGGPLCLLTGPAGAGKTSTVRVLAREMKLELQEWSNPLTPSASQWDQDFVPSRPDFVPVGGYQSSTQAGHFREFLLRANRYPTLQLGRATNTINKLILVEEIPHTFHRDASLFHDIIRNHCRSGVSPLLFIFSDITTGDSAERLLFPKQLQAELGITNISFNPVATTSMIKVMQRVSSAEALQSSRRFVTPSKATLEAVSAASMGDIRGAINALQFVCLRGCSDVTAAVSQSQRAKSLTAKSSKLSKSMTKQKQDRSGKSWKSVSKKGRKSTSNDNDDNLAAIGGRDTSLFLFRALGKILYCKRSDPTENPDYQPMPKHLSHLDRDPLLCVPEDIIEKCHLTGDSFIAYLHQNYIGFYYDIEDVTRATDYFSDTDYMCANWEGRTALSPYAASVASRGIMFSNSTRGRTSTTSGTTSGLGWKPLHKPAWYETVRKARDNNTAARGLFKELSFICPPQELLTQVLPGLVLTRKTGLRPGQPGFLREVCTFRSYCQYRQAGERLDEKDIAGCQEDGDDLVSSVATRLYHHQGETVVSNQIPEEEQDGEIVIEAFHD